MRNLIKASVKPMATVNKKLTRYEQSKKGGYFLTECRTPNGRLILSEGETEQQSKEGVKEIQLARFIKRQNNIRQHNYHNSSEGFGEGLGVIEMMTVMGSEAKPEAEKKQQKRTQHISNALKALNAKSLIHKAV